MMSPPPKVCISDIRIGSIVILGSIELLVTHPIYFYLIVWILSFRRLSSDHSTLYIRKGIMFSKNKKKNGTDTDHPTLQITERTGNWNCLPLVRKGTSTRWWCKCHCQEEVRQSFNFSGLERQFWPLSVT